MTILDRCTSLLVLSVNVKLYVFFYKKKQVNYSRKLFFMFFCPSSSVIIGVLPSVFFSKLCPISEINLFLSWLIIDGFLWLQLHETWGHQSANHQSGLIYSRDRWPSTLQKYFNSKMVYLSELPSRHTFEGCKCICFKQYMLSYYQLWNWPKPVLHSETHITYFTTLSRSNLLEKPGH